MRIYDPDQVLVTFGGVPIKGFADGEFIRVEPESPNFAVVVGTDGDVTRSKTGNRVVRVTIPLMQSSDSNAHFSAIAQIDLRTPNGAGVTALAIKDMNGVTELLDPSAFIEGWPSQSFDRTATAREWVIVCPDPEIIIGGNF